MKEGKQSVFAKTVEKTFSLLGFALWRRAASSVGDSVRKNFLLFFLEKGGLAFFLFAAPPQQSCVDVAVGSAQSYACLNQQLGEVANQAHRPSSTDAPYSATSPGNVTGQFNEDATRNRLGSNFGRSVTPERPAYAPPASPLPRH